MLQLFHWFDSVDWFDSFDLFDSFDSFDFDPTTKIPEISPSHVPIPFRQVPPDPDQYSTLLVR